MSCNRLQLNTSKTSKFFGARRIDGNVRFLGVRFMSTKTVTPSTTVRDLGIYTDYDASMKTHVMKTVSNCFAALCQIHSVRRSVTRPVLMSLVTSLVISRSNYGNATAGLPVYLSNRLQSVLNAATRLVYLARKYDHVTSLLQELHWLRVSPRIDYKLAVLTFRCLHGQAPPYLTESLLRTADVDSRRHLRSAMTNSLVVPSTRHSTIGNCSFAAPTSRVWNSLPSRVTSLSSVVID